MVRAAALIAFALLAGCDQLQTLSASEEDISISIGPGELQYGQALSVPITVRNLGDRRFEMIDLECALTTPDGNVVAGHVFFTNVGQGASATEPGIWMEPAGIVECRLSGAY